VAIQGAIAATYTPAVSGIYTVRAQVNNCWTAFSAPLNYVLTGINSPELERAIWIGPNPVPDQLYVQYTGTTGSLTITITDMWGRNIYRSNFSGPLMVDMRSYLAGAYIIYIKNQRNGQELRKMIIKN
jgi:hypothetical protein